MRRTLVTGLSLSALFLVGSWAAGSGTASPACRASTGTSRSTHIAISLGGFADAATVDHPFYFASEDAGAGRIELLALAHVCNETASVHYETRAQTAASDVDFGPVAGRVELFIPHVGGRSVVGVPVHPDGLVEPPLESFGVFLSNPRNGSLREPSAAPFYVIDVDGSSRATLDPEPHRVGEGRVVQVVVFRAGPASGTLTVPYLVEPSGAAPAMPGEDYEAPSDNSLTFGPGERVRSIEIAVIDDGVAEAAETLSISLTQPSADSVRETTVTIEGEVDIAPPRSRFHHPRDGWSYRAADLRIREIHVFTRDSDSGVVEVDLALRRKASDGVCAWWDGARFDPGSCSDPRWLRMDAYEVGFFYYYRMDLLRPSVGSRIKSYMALARALDAAGNHEEKLIAGRNRNTFEVVQDQEVNEMAGAFTSLRSRGAGGKGRIARRLVVGSVAAALIVTPASIGLGVRTSEAIGLADRVRVKAARERWRPTHLYIAAGTTVVWTNPDSRRHNVVSYGGGWRFNHVLDPGDRTRRAFSEVRNGGKPYRYRCTLHSALVDGRCEGMCGFIHVFVA